MFGMKRKDPQQDTQIPYEVYATMQEPVARRRAWFVRLLAMLIVVTLLILGGLLLKRTFLDNKKTPSETTSQTPSGQDTSTTPSTNQAQPAQGVVQSPQQNTPTTGNNAGAPATLPQSNAQNTSTVRKPE